MKPCLIAGYKLIEFPNMLTVRAYANANVSEHPPLWTISSGDLKNSKQLVTLIWNNWQRASMWFSSFVNILKKQK